MNPYSPSQYRTPRHNHNSKGPHRGISEEEDSIASQIRQLCSEILQWETSPSMSSMQAAANTVMKAYALVHRYVQVVRSTSAQTSTSTTAGRSGIRSGVHNMLEMVSGVIQQHFTETVEPIIWAALHDPHIEFRGVYEEQWRQYIVSVADLRTIFLPADISWADPNPNSGIASPTGLGGHGGSIKESRSVEVMAMELWKSRILHHAEPTTFLSDAPQEVSVIGRLNMEVNDLIDRHRELQDSLMSSSSVLPGDNENEEESGANNINSSYNLETRKPFRHGDARDTKSALQTQLTCLARTIITLRDDLNMLPLVHTEDIFLEEYLRRMEEWYHNKCTSASAKGIRQYTSASLRFVEQEQHRAALCFRANRKVTQTLLRVVLRHMPLSITEETLFIWMREVGEGRGCEEELRGVFQLVVLEDRTGGFVGAAFKEYSTRAFHRLVQSTLPFLSSPPSSVAVNNSQSAGAVLCYEEECDKILRELLSVLWQLERIVSVAFQEMSCMQEAIEIGFRKGAAGWKTVDLSGMIERLAVMVHLLVRRGGVVRSDDQLVSDSRSNNNNSIKPDLFVSKDVVRLYCLIQMLSDRRNMLFLEAHQRLLASRLLLFFTDVEEISPQLAMERREAKVRQCSVERELLGDFRLTGTNPSIFRCEWMLDGATSQQGLLVEKHCALPPPRSSAVHKPTGVWVKSRVIPAGRWLCGASGESSLHPFPFLHRETQRSLKRVAPLYPGREVKLCGEYSTGIVKLLVPVPGSTSPSSTVELRLELSLMQLCIVLCFNKQRCWKLKALRETIMPRELSVQFHTGLSALCAKRVLRSTKTQEVVLGNSTELYALWESTTGKSSHPSDTPTVCCLTPEVLSQPTSAYVDQHETTQYTLARGGATTRTTTATSIRMPNAQTNNSKTGVVEDGVVARVVRILKQSGPSTLKELSASLTNESITSPKYKKFELNTLKMTIEKLLERGHIKVETQEGNLVGDRKYSFMT